MIADVDRSRKTALPQGACDGLLEISRIPGEPGLRGDRGDRRSGSVVRAVRLGAQTLRGQGGGRAVVVRRPTLARKHTSNTSGHDTGDSDGDGERVRRARVMPSTGRQGATGVGAALTVGVGCKLGAGETDGVGVTVW